MQYSSYFLQTWLENSYKNIMYNLQTEWYMYNVAVNPMAAGSVQGVW